MATEDFAVREIAALRPRLREGLRFSLQEQGGRRVCVIEDPAAARFHRVGLEEYRFLRALDGTRTVAAILAQLAREGGDAFSEAEAMQILRGLRDLHLLAVESGRNVPEDREHQERTWRAVAWLNPLVCKIPLFQPDLFCTRLESVARPLLGWRGFALWLMVLIVGAAHVGMDWHRFAADSEGVLSRDNWLWLFLAWTGLKIAHECSHGLYCKFFGAAVREAGAIFVVFVPMGYIDATASLGLASRWRRMMVSSAGLYMEFFIAAVAAIVWARTDPGAVHSLAYNTVVIGTVVTLFFNANPLMRFDGYYLLSDLLEVPNLATRGRMWFQRAVSWLLVGGKPAVGLRPTTREGWITAAYGCLAVGWQILVLAGLFVAASATLRGGGLLLAVMAGVTWVALPLLRFGQGIATSLRAGGGSAGTLVVRIFGAAALVAAVLFVPWHQSVSGDGVVELGQTEVLRAECPGFIVREYVEDGEVVAAGQLLVELRNEEAAAELAQRRLTLAQQELRARLAYTRDDIATFQAEQASTAALHKDIAEREAFLATLQIHAPFAGRVSHRQLGRRGGVFVSAGEEILHLGRTETREIKLAVSESAEPDFRAALGRTVEARIDSRGLVLEGQLIRVEARATREPVHPALTALFGGPLALRRSEEGSEGRSRSSQSYELAEPHFNATVQVATPDALFAGETARVRFRSTRAATLWSEINTAFARWLRRHSPA